MSEREDRLARMLGDALEVLEEPGRYLDGGLAKLRTILTSEEEPMVLEPPVFFNFAEGPALAFHPSLEDHRAKLMAHWRLKGEMSVVTMDRGDVEQLSRFLKVWLDGK